MSKIEPNIVLREMKGNEIAEGLAQCCGFNVEYKELGFHETTWSIKITDFTPPVYINKMYEIIRFVTYPCNVQNKESIPTLRGIKNRYEQNKIKISKHWDREEDNPWSFSIRAEIRTKEQFQALIDSLLAAKEILSRYKE